MNAAAAVAVPRAAARRSRWPWYVLAVLSFVALFGPLLANEAPLLARVGGRYHLPAFADLFGTASPGPAGVSWPEWRRALTPGSADFCVGTPWPHGPRTTDLALVRASPSWSHPFGNDDSGRDVLARILRGTRPAFGMGMLGVLLAAVLGTALGALAGYCRGATDVLVLRLVELFHCFPTVLLLLTGAAFFGSSVWSVVLVLGLTMWPSFARIVRGELLALREREFVQVAQGLGVSHRDIVVGHLLPLVRGQVGVTAAFCLAAAVIAESTLSFLGIGPGSQQSSWGSILMQGKSTAHLGIWHLWLFPAAAIATATLCCHAIAERLRPRL